MILEISFQPEPPAVALGIYTVDEIANKNPKPYDFVASDRLMGGCEYFRPKRYKDFVSALLDYDTKPQQVWIFDPIT